MADNTGPRYDEEFSITNVDGKVTHMRMIDRLSVDDVVLHLIYKEIYKITDNKDLGIDVNRNFKDFLVKERFIGG